jgi:hypothetical protein
MWPKPSRWLIDATPIVVSVLPQAESTASNPQDSGSKRLAVPRQEPTRRSEAATRPSSVPAKVAKKNSPVVPETPMVPRELPAPKEPNREELRPTPRERIPDPPTVVERPLPSVKELLPPIGWSGNPRARRGDGPIDWDTKNPQYVFQCDQARDRNGLAVSGTCAEVRLTGKTYAGVLHSGQWRSGSRQDRPLFRI